MLATVLAVIVTTAALAITGCGRPEQRPLWPGARYTVADRDRAMRHGLEFISSIARDPAIFARFGGDLLDAFQNIGHTNADVETGILALETGRERAKEWRRLHPSVPQNATAYQIASLVFGSDSADRLGVPDPAMHAALVQAAGRFPPSDFLGFDPAREPPPDRSRLFDALIYTYTGDEYGASIGGSLASVMRWIPAMRPWPARASLSEKDFYDTVYAVTHIVYTANHYNEYRLDPNCFPDEFEFLKANLPEAIKDQDPETLGEYLDSLRAFGLTFSDPPIQNGVEYLISAQNPDGSWGDPHESDPYTRYHATWTAIGGIQDFQWTKTLPCKAN